MPYWFSNYLSVENIHSFSLSTDLDLQMNKKKSLSNEKNMSGITDNDCARDASFLYYFLPAEYSTDKRSTCQISPCLFGISCRRLSITCTKERDNKDTDGVSQTWDLFVCCNE